MNRNARAFTVPPEQAMGTEVLGGFSKLIRFNTSDLALYNREKSQQPSLFRKCKALSALRLETTIDLQKVSPLLLLQELSLVI